MKKNQIIISLLLLSMPIFHFGCGSDESESDSPTDGDASDVSSDAAQSDAAKDADDANQLDAGNINIMDAESPMDGSSNGSSKRDAGDSSDSEELTKECETFINYFNEECQIPSEYLGEIEEFCSMLDQTMNDSFMNGFVDCIQGHNCSDFESDDDAGMEDGIPEPIESCFDSTISSVEPEKPNLDFREYFCQLMVKCTTTSQNECENSFWQNDESQFLKVLGQPYIDRAIDCVYPIPECDNRTRECLETVLNSIGLFQQ